MCWSITKSTSSTFHWYLSLFSPWFSWKNAELSLNNTHSLLSHKLSPPSPRQMSLWIHPCLYCLPVGSPSNYSDFFIVFHDLTSLCRSRHQRTCVVFRVFFLIFCFSDNIARTDIKTRKKEKTKQSKIGKKSCSVSICIYIS